MNQRTQISSFLFFLKSRYFRCLPVSQSCSSRPPAKPSGLKAISTWSVSSVNSPPASGCRWPGRLPRTRSPRQLQHKQKERGRRRRREAENKKTSDLQAKSTSEGGQQTAAVRFCQWEREHAVTLSLSSVLLPYLVCPRILWNRGRGCSDSLQKQDMENSS